MLYIHRAQPSDSILSTRYICHNSRPRERALKNVTRFRCKTGRISLWHDIFLNMSIINSAQVYSPDEKIYFISWCVDYNPYFKNCETCYSRHRSRILNDVETRVSSNLFYRRWIFFRKCTWNCLCSNRLNFF